MSKRVLITPASLDTNFPSHTRTPRAPIIQMAYHNSPVVLPVYHSPSTVASSNSTGGTATSSTVSLTTPGTDNRSFAASTTATSTPSSPVGDSGASADGAGEISPAGWRSSSSTGALVSVSVSSGVPPWEGTAVGGWNGTEDPAEREGASYPC